MPIPRLLSIIRESQRIKAVRASVFSGLEFKEKIARPVIVNLLTAFLFFIAIVALRDPLYNYFFSHNFSTVHWPIFCVFEPKFPPASSPSPSPADPGHKTVTAELFVVNL